MKKKLIVMLSFIMILSLFVVACKKPTESSKDDSDKQSTQQSEVLSEEQSEESFNESVSISNGATSEVESEIESETASENTSEVESETQSIPSSEVESEIDSTPSSEVESEIESETTTESESNSESGGNEDPEEEYITVSLTYQYADGTRDWHGQRQVLKGLGYEDVIRAYCPEGTHDRFINDLKDFLVEGRSVLGGDWTLQEDCQVELVLKTLRFRDNISDVGLRIVNEEGEVLLQDVTRILKYTTVRYVLKEKFLFTEEELSYVTDMYIDLYTETEDCDFSSNLITDCVLNLVVSQPITNLIETTMIVKDANGNVVYNESMTAKRSATVQSLLLNYYRIYDEYFRYFEQFTVNGKVVGEHYQIYEKNCVVVVLLNTVLVEECEVKLVVKNYDGSVIFDRSLTGEIGLTIEEWVVEIFNVNEIVYGKIDVIRFNGNVTPYHTQIDENGTIEIMLLNNETVEVNLIIKDCDGNVIVDRTLTEERGLNVEDWLIDVFGVQNIIYGKIDTLRFNGELVNTGAEVYTDGTIEITLIEGLDIATVTYQLNVNGADTVEMSLELPVGTSIIDVLLAISEGDESILQMVYDVQVDGEPVDYTWVLNGDCHIVVYLQLEMPPFGLCNVSLIGDDTDGNKMYDMHQQVEQNTLVIDALTGVFGFSQEDIEKIVTITLNGEPVDIYNTQIVEDCTIEVTITNVSGGDVAYIPVRVEVHQGESVETDYVTMHSETISLEEIIKIIFGRSYEELAKEGTFYLNYEEELSADSIIYAGQTVIYVIGGVTEDVITVTINGESIQVPYGTTVGTVFAGADLSMVRILVNGEEVGLDRELCDGDYVSLEPIGDMGGHNVWFDADEDGEFDGLDQFFVPRDTTLEAFINDWASTWWHLSYNEAISQGYFTVNGIEVDRYYVLSPEDQVVFVRNEVGGGCNHNFDEQGYCPDCGFWCYHDTNAANVPCGICGNIVIRRVQVDIYLFYADVYEDGSYSLYYKQSSFYRELRYNENVTTQDAVIESLGHDFGPDEQGTVRIWYRNGEVINGEEYVENGDVIMGIPENVQNLPFTVKIEVEDKESVEYTFTYPISIQRIYERYFADYGELNLDYYNVYLSDEHGQSIYEDLIWENVSIRLTFTTTDVSFKVIGENGISEGERFSFRADQKPTLAEFLSERGISEREYYIYNYSNLTDVVNAGTDYYDLTAIKKSIVATEFTVNVTYYNENGDEFKGNLVLNEPITLETLWNMELGNEETGYFHIGWERENIYQVNGVRYNFVSTGDPSYVFIYNDADVVVKMGYYISLEVNGEYQEGVFEERLTGEEIIVAFGLDIDINDYVVEVSSSIYDTEMFLNEKFPQDESRSTHIYLKQGRVHVDIYYSDSLGGWYSDNYEAEGRMSISQIISEETFNSCDWYLYEVNEYGDRLDKISLTDYNFVLEFNKNNCDYWGMTKYHLEGESKYFSVLLYIDDEWIGEQTFAKAEGLTFGQILATFGDYKYGDYTWNFYGDSSYLEENTVITSRIEASGYDNRPRFTLYVDNDVYVIYHTKDMTLGEIIDAVNAEYGVSINYDDYIWDYDTTLEYIVASEGYWGELRANTLTYVEVYFYAGTMPAWFEDGKTSSCTYQIDDEWITPTRFETYEYNGLAKHTGRWVYFSKETEEGEEIIISSLEELFALKEYAVELHAEFELDYNVLNGTYFVDTERLVVIENDHIIVYNAYHNTEAYNGEYTVDYNWRIEFLIEGVYLDSGMLNEYTKIDKDEVCIITREPWGSMNSYDSIELYIESTSSYDVVSITTITGEKVEEITLGNVYVVELQEKMIEEW